MFKLLKIDISEDFTNFVSTHIKNKMSEYKKIVFVSSNRRQLLYVKNELDIDCLMKSDFYTIEDFVKQTVLKYFTDGLIVHSKAERELFILDMIKKFFPEIYVKLGNDESKVYIWAKKISALFDDIDMNLLGERLKNFQYVEAIEPAREILENLKAMYEKYEQIYGGYGYRGIFHKIFSQADFDYLKTDFKNTFFVFAGMLYFTESEKLILKRLGDAFDLDFILQTDMFARDKVKINGENYDFETFDIADKAVKEFDIKEENIFSFKKEKASAPNIEFFEFSNTHYNSSFFGGKVKAVLNKIKDKENPKNIGLVLPNSSSLYPLLNNLDDNLPLNITLGYPFANTDFGLFLINFLELLLDIHMKFSESNRYSCDGRLLFQTLNGGIAKFFKETEIIEDIKSQLLKYQSGTFYFEENDFFLRQILMPFLQATNFNSLYQAFINFYEHLDLKKLKLEEHKFTAQMIQLFYREAVDFLQKLENRQTNIKFICNFLAENIKELSIPFEGNPLRGVQIMGVLEARQISFKYLFITDVNEGILPLKNKVDPLLPENIKTEIGLHGFREKEKLIKYHFFKMIYSAENVFISYKIGSNAMEKSIKSRFIDQLILIEEAKKNPVKINKFFARLPSMKSEKLSHIEKDVELDDFFKNRVNQGMFSPSELDTYLNCPYKYYLQRVRNIEKPLKLDSNFEANIVGIMAHDILEKAFKDYCGKLIDFEIYKTIRRNALHLVEKLDKNYMLLDDKNQEEVSLYLHKLSNFQFEAMKKIFKFKLHAFFDETQSTSLPFKLLHTEKKLIGKTYKLKGIADRIDEIENEDKKLIRIVDYKTGYSVKKPKVKKLSELKNINFEIFDKKNLELVKDILVSTQFPAYLLMAEEEFCRFVCAEIYLLSGTGKKIVEKIEGKNLELYGEIINYIINHMSNCENIFPLPGHNCTYCEYANFCEFKE